MKINGKNRIVLPLILLIACSILMTAVFCCYAFGVSGINDRLSGYVITGDSQRNDIEEMINRAKEEGEDIVWLLSPADDKDRDMIDCLNRAGFTIRDTDRYCAGVLHDGEAEQFISSEPVAIQYRADGSMATAKGADGNKLILNGREIACPAGLIAFSVRWIQKNTILNKTVSSLYDALTEIKNGHCLAVIGITYKQGKQMPGYLKRFIEDLGLKEYDENSYSPYLAVLNGRRIVCNESGGTYTEVSYKDSVNGISIEAVCSTSDKKGRCSVLMNDQEFKSSGYGISLYLYDLQKGSVVLNKFYDWRDNHVTSANYRKTDNVFDLIYAAQLEKNDIICLHSLSSDGTPANDYLLNALHAAGFDELDPGHNYIGYLSSVGSCRQMKDEAKISCQEGIVSLSCSKTAKKATVDGIVYSDTKDTVYIIIYDPTTNTVLAAKSFPFAQ